MILFEILTGYTGESYERCYAWAETRERAIEMFREKHPNREAKIVQTILESKEGEFITCLDDSGIPSMFNR